MESANDPHSFAHVCYLDELLSGGHFNHGMLHHVYNHDPRFKRLTSIVHRANDAKTKAQGQTPDGTSPEGNRGHMSKKPNHRKHGLSPLRSMEL